MFQFENSAGRYGMHNPPLQRALVDLQYPLSPRLVTTEGLSELQERLIERFPIMRPVAPLGFSVSIGAPVASPMPGQDSRYQFINESGFDVMIGTSSATVSCSGKAYKDRSQIADILHTVVGVLRDLGRISQCDRVGVRYVNAAPASRKEWVSWFKPEYTGWTETGVVDENVKRVVMIVTQLASPASGDVTAATIRHGYLPNGIGDDVTASAAGKEPSFLVDIDMACDQKRPFDPDEIAAHFKRINNEIARCLRHSFSPEGETQFGVYALSDDSR